MQHIGYIRNESQRLAQVLGNELDAPITKADLRDVARLLYELANFVDLQCQNSRVRVPSLRTRP